MADGASGRMHQAEQATLAKAYEAQKCVWLQVEPGGGCWVLFRCLLPGDLPCPSSSFSLFKNRTSCATWWRPLMLTGQKLPTGGKAAHTPVPCPLSLPVPFPGNGLAIKVTEQQSRNIFLFKNYIFPVIKTMHGHCRKLGKYRKV